MITFQPVDEPEVAEVEAVEGLLPPIVERQDVVVVEPESRSLTPVEQVMGMIAAASRDPTVDVAKMRELFSLQKEMMAIQALQRFEEGLGRVQARCPRIPKNGVVNLGTGKGSYNFARWEDMDSLVGPILRDEGFTVTFSEDSSDQNGIRWGASWRAFGHTERNFITLPPDNSAGKNALQARGSTNAYAKRYLTEDFLKLVREGDDDDGVTGGWVGVTPEQVDELYELLEGRVYPDGRVVTEAGFIGRMASDAAGNKIAHFSKMAGHDFVRVANTLRAMKKVETDAPTDP